jgi:uncharacterized OB-fold protein
MPGDLDAATSRKRADPEGRLNVDVEPTFAALLPVDDDPDTAGFFDAAHHGHLALRRCDDCLAIVHMPCDHCRRCGSWNVAWAEIDATATLYSWTTVAHQVHPGYPVPYTIIVVELVAEPGVHLVGRIAGAPQLTAGEPMEFWIDALTSGNGEVVRMPNWRPRDSRGATVT